MTVKEVKEKMRLVDIQLGNLYFDKEELSHSLEEVEKEIKSLESEFKELEDLYCQPGD